MNFSDLTLIGIPVEYVLLSIPGALILLLDAENFIRFFRILEISFWFIKPGLNILILDVKSTTVDSRPIADLFPFRIIFKEFPNSLATSSAVTGLTLVDLFALGIARGNFKIFNILLKV